jgi:hypothetical protein
MAVVPAAGVAQSAPTSGAAQAKTDPEEVAGNMAAFCGPHPLAYGAVYEFVYQRCVEGTRAGWAAKRLSGADGLAPPTAGSSTGVPTRRT